MLENDLPHNELVWWRMTKKQRYLPGRTVILELENKTVGIEEEHEKILRKLIKHGSVIIHSFDDMKYAVCNSSNVRLYPTFSEQEQKSLEKECIKSTKVNYRALLRIKKIVELRKLDQAQFESNKTNMSPLEIRMIQFFKDKDSIINISESIQYLENNTAIELLGSIVNRKTLKTMIGQSPQAYFYLDKNLLNEKNRNILEKEQDTITESIESKHWQNELNEIIVNRKTICELLSCIPFELLSSKYNEKRNVELIINKISANDCEDQMIEKFCKQNIDSIYHGKFIIEYIKLSILYLRILSKSIALRVVNANQKKKTRNKSASQYVIVLSLELLFCDPYEVKMLSLTKLKYEEKNISRVNNWLGFLHIDADSNSSSNEVLSNNLEKSNAHDLSLCFKTTIPDKNSRKNEFYYKVDLNRISSQLVISEELQNAYNFYSKEFNLEDLEHRTKLFHVIKTSCPMMIKLLREWIMSVNGGDFDHLGSIDQLKKIKENLLNVDK
ncbi:uncharacterized protein cubi_00201 [Cryptosporidium ubiquitum]|uniref:Uncharacterized protein n=1 Tax=Cryptosporidium ubiquitum TaxID=857276 RepID=A0A1J4MKA5_9CRYT|nr:uncharacterized protein cubi_00201 [Cryptosporidium ubiquitum]OII74648.1 hypothetical protein cubi_00201 [Cryptosporidium ubiquitum]